MSRYHPQARWIKLCKETKLIGRGLTSTDCDLMFAKVAGPAALFSFGWGHPVCSLVGGIACVAPWHAVHACCTGQRTVTGRRCYPASRQPHKLSVANGNVLRHRPEPETMCAPCVPALRR